MRSVILAIVLLLTPSLAEAAPKPMDFAYGAPLSLEGSGAVCRLSVPREVYEAVTRHDLADIHVFNSRETAVPLSCAFPDNRGRPPSMPGRCPFSPSMKAAFRPEKRAFPCRSNSPARGP